ncbi:hypothetical protein [Enterobacter phage vB-EclM_KMB19]|uniref:Uncharacterized protein n=1 Tax=Cronobacter phage Pet-CM3-4 TaxID=1892569 RepID=A0A1D3RLF9_9CAUD|nr:hypothetical protein KNT70_gp166 [Cronobacter phage Pet-CM3-4]ULA52482.1 hypothetical protein [Enterobacter phage vB-EclM_KMB19]SCN45937.1 hypothetical protein [Cronobacter phage Pet-CM3-4]
MFYVLSEDYSYDGSKNIWAGNNLVQLFDRASTPKCMSLVEDEYYNLVVEVFSLEGTMVKHVYVEEKHMKSFDAFKKLLKVDD